MWQRGLYVYAQPSGNRGRYTFRVSSDAMNHLRRQRIQKVQADEEEPGSLARCRPCAAARRRHQHRKSIRRTLLEPSAPDDVGDVEDATVLEQRRRP